AGEDGQAHPVDRDRALLHQVGPRGGRAAEAVGGRVAVRRDRLQAADGVDVSLDDVAAQAIAQLERALEVQPAPDGQPAERRAGERLGREVGHEPRAGAAHDGQTRAVHGDALADGEPRERTRRRDRETRPGTARLAPLETARRLDDAGEHGALDDLLGTVEEAAEPGLALARRERLELAPVEPDALAGRTLVDGDALVHDGGERLAAARAGQLLGIPAIPEARKQLAVPFGEVAVLLRLLLLVQLLAEPVLLIRHLLSSSSG